MKIIQTIKKKTIFTLTFMVLAAISFACSGVIETGVPADQVERIVAETMQAIPTDISPTSPPTATQTPILSTSGPATKTTLPTSPPILPAATRINFAPGATYGIAQGTIQAGQTQNFVLEAQQGQPMLASVSSPSNDLTMSITANDGTALLPASQGWSNWQGTLPATQDYFFQIIGGASTEDFTLWVSIPSRIEFASGAISATVSGKTVEGYIASYVVAAQGGQTMNILLTPNPNSAALTVWGFSDGQPYIRAQMGSTTFNMQLPSTQDYIIDVVPQGGQEVDFSLKVEIK